MVRYIFLRSIYCLSLCLLFMFIIYEYLLKNSKRCVTKGRNLCDSERSYKRSLANGEAISIVFGHFFLKTVEIKCVYLLFFKHTMFQLAIETAWKNS
jgi:hypothetical protein